MKRFFLFMMTTSVIATSAIAKTTEADTLKSNDLNEVIVVGNKAQSRTPVAQVNLTAKDIESLPTASNIPHVLWMTPSLVAFGENGTGTGYSYMRIRGVDASRINVTLNGMPQNNAESQEMFWVDVPDLASGIQNLQIQRGVGTSTNGSAAFGGSINMQTRYPGLKPYAESTTSAGSYGTIQENIALGTGLFGNGFSMDLRYSNLQSDGYIRNGWCDHESLFASLSKRFNKALLRVNYIYGKENTGITWEGIGQAQFDADPTFNPAGAKGDGTYYDNESDNYWQHHFQVFYTQELKQNLLLNAGLNYTDGFGYYEQFKTGDYMDGESFESMGLPDQTVGGITYDKTFLIRRKNMANGYYIGTLNMQYNQGPLSLQTGAMASVYSGDHYANLLWVEHNQNIPSNFEWVRNHAVKQDGNLFAKAEYALTNNLNAWVDVQYRYVSHELEGLDDDDLTDMSQKRVWNFFNPKAGLFYQLNETNKLFASVASAHREPTRADIKDSRKSGSVDHIKAEQLTDVELGYTFDNSKLMFGVNVYGMFYKDQLVATGKLNEVGYALMSNVDKSYRMGVELQSGYKPFEWMQLDANATFSTNKVLDQTIWYETYDNSTDWGDATAQQSQHFSKLSLPYSPELIAALGLTVQPIQSLSINATAKHVGAQFYTLTQDEGFKLPAYQHVNLSAKYDFKISSKLNASIGLFCNNLLSRKYACNAWGYEARFENGDDAYVQKGLYVVAPRNYLAKFTLKFQ